jgi:hypothetical protein
MRDVNELLRRKEADLQNLQKEIEAIRLVVRLLAQDEEAAEVNVAPGGTVATLPRPAVQAAPSNAARTYSAAWDKTPTQFP